MYLKSQFLLIYVTGRSTQRVFFENGKEATTIIEV